ncbi:ATP-binding cassette domain-containing protein [Actinosynnema pretiosum subsp. pretiosum]|uniref:ATP-binding cassette domain-containing protein n=1 Tax=Actinosynnema pretiosum subsp. pretiosum TaxID=103721 RepID=A0AA45L5Y9_9PSEU|nr:ABC transporter, ATP-binding protein [Actinosynnema pretiosum subsp. pretiosum]QUF03937.1 ATP-binding cassette domain-containing protein [Actinosynnema pretiosum subsp. pretiosum]
MATEQAVLTAEGLRHRYGDLVALDRKRVAALSGGQRQRVQLAMALVADPALLVLDEPTTGPDTQARRDFWHLVEQRRARGVGVLVTTHVIEGAAAVANRVVVLDRGAVLVDATPTEPVSRLPDRTITATTTLDVTVLRALLDLDPALARLRVRDAGLEEAVLALTAARDEGEAA